MFNHYFCLFSFLFIANQLAYGHDDYKPHMATSDSGFVENHDTVAPTLHITQGTLERLANITQDNNLWILAPSNLTGQHLGDTDFSLFKLNTDTLASEQDLPSINSDDLGSTSSPREGRKMGLFSNVLNKPKVSPLYLVNGTVCRFVNSQPICTTLSTTGLFRGQNQGFFSNQLNNGGGFNANNNNGNNQGFFNAQNNNNQNPQQRQTYPPQQQGMLFNQQQQQQNGNFQNFRPSAALLDDDTPGVSVASNSSTQSDKQTLAGKQSPIRQQVVMSSGQANRPMSYVLNRRPLNLLSFGRPFKSPQYQVVRGARQVS